MGIVHKISRLETKRSRPARRTMQIAYRYEGIFDRFTPVSELVLAGLLQKEVAAVKDELNLLHHFSIIEYRPQKDNPQILLLRNRVKAEDLTIDMQAYQKRKEKFQLRVKKIIHFIKEKTECRSRMIGSYFGDEAARSCGICDNCLRLKAITMSKEEFETIFHRILNTVKYEALPAKELLIKLNGIKKEKAWKVIEFLQAENKIEMDPGGWVRLK